MKHHRLKIVVKPQDIVALYVGGRWCRSTSPFPPDTRVVEGHWNAEREGIVLTLEHPTFPEVEEGQEGCVWFRVEQKTSEEPQFGFYLKPLAQYLADHEYDPTNEVLVALDTQRERKG